MIKTGYGVVVGRFQCADLHDGHMALLSHVYDLHPNKMIVILAIKRTPENASNPLSYTMRVAMIREQFPHAIIRPLLDERDDIVWSNELDKLIASVVGNDQPTLYSGRDGFFQWYTGRYPKEELPKNIPNVSATQERQIIKGYPLCDSSEFREGVVYAHQTRIHQVYETVDIAITKDDAQFGKLLLLGKKKNEPLWRFPGGFVEPGETFEQAGKRELREETGLWIEGRLTIISDFILDEWRLRNQKGVSHRTVLLMGDYSWGGIKASDDLEDAKWVSLYGQESNLMEEHIPLYNALLEKLK